jgi:hypothetical protein
MIPHGDLCDTWSVTPDRRFEEVYPGESRMMFEGSKSSPILMTDTRIHQSKRTIDLIQFSGEPQIFFKRLSLQVLPI